MLAFLNFIVAAALLAIVVVFGVIGWLWGAKMMLAFIAGWIGSTCIWQLGHRTRYGKWFERPVYRPSNEAR